MSDSIEAMIERAAHMGTWDANYALTYGGLSDAPLSGEWADGKTPASLARDLGYMGDDGDVIDALADAYESAYFECVADDETAD